MIVTYAPEGGAAQRWEFNPQRVRASEAEAIEKRAGETWDAWLVGVQSGSMKARRVLLWHMLRRDHPTVRYEDVPDFYAGEVLVEHTSAELTEMRDRVAKANIPADQREQALTALDVALTEAMSREADEPEPEGKARSRRAASGTP